LKKGFDRESLRNGRARCQNTAHHVNGDSKHPHVSGFYELSAAFLEIK